MSKASLLEQTRALLRLKHESIRTEQAYLCWIHQYIFFHNKQRLSVLSADHIHQFLSSIASNRHVAASTQNQALCALGSI